MIKYIEYDAYDETGQHITPVNTLYHLNKTAAGTYSPEIMKIILNMKRKPDRYYVVINALGSHEVWGSNRNGDGFPASALSHKSLRTDMGTDNDYGYKTFEYYAVLFRHHVNKDPKKGFGEVVFAHWNPVTQRVELIVAVNTETGKDIVDALENGDNVAVSMGCLTDPEYPILTITGYKPIKDIIVGDLVMTHKGRWKKVTDLHRRKYTGKLYNIYVRGLPIPLELTDEHPVLLKSFKKESLNKDRSYINPKQFDKKEYEWIKAKNIEAGDHVKFTGTNYNRFDYCSIESEEFAKLMGYYISEGSFTYNNGKPAVIQLSCHIDDELPKEVPGIVNKLFPETKCSIRPHHNSDNGLSVDIFSTDLAGFMDKYFGHLANNKFIPPEIFVSDENIKLSFIGAWISGDGFCDKKGVHISSCNRELLLQARDLFMSLNIPSSIYKITHKPGSGFSRNETIEYTLNISHLDAESLIKYSEKKLKNLPNIISDRKKDGNSAIRSNNDGSYSYSVKSVNIREVEDIQTYNFSVEDDESYIAAGLTIHNCKVKYDRCSICDNKAKTRAQYCKHLKNHMNEIISKETSDRWSKELGKIILPGSQVFAWNDYPRFFDISKVHIGADRTAFVLGKAASEKATASVDIAEAYGVTDEHIDKLSMVGKKSEIDKEIGGALGPTDIDGSASKINNNTIFRKALDERMNNTIAAEPLLPKNTLDSISALPLETIFSTMLGMGIYPKPAEVQRIIIIKIGRKDIADELDKRNEIFNYRDCDDISCDLDISNKNFSDTLGKVLIPFLEKRSYFPSYLKKRIEDSFTKTAYYSSTEAGKDYWNQSNLEGNPFIKPQKSNINPLLAGLVGLGAVYGAIKLKSMGYGPKQLSEVFVNKPWLRALVGGGVMWKIFNSINKLKENNEIMRPASDYEGILQDTNFSGHIKSGSFNEIEEALILPNAYISNASNQTSFINKHKHLFPESEFSLNKIASANEIVIGTNSLITDEVIKSMNKKLLNILPKVG